MERINLSRLILGGIVAGIVGDVLAFLVDGVMLGPQWAASMKALGRPDFTSTQWIAFNLMGIVSGIFAVWLYAAIRPRFGAGPKTAVLAGLAVWFIGILLPNVGFMGVAGLFPTDLTLMTTTAGIVEWAIAALAGCALYKEAEGSARSMAARA